MKPMAAIGNGGIDIVVDPHSIQTEKREMFYLFGTLGIGAAVFHMGLRSKRKSLVKCRLAYFGDRNRSQQRANPCFHSEGIENIGFMSVTVNEAVGIHFPVNGHQRDRVVIVVQVSGHTERKLFHGIEAGDRTGFFSRRIQCGKKQSCKNRNNRDRYKKLYKRESLFPCHPFFCHPFPPRFYPCLCRRIFVCCFNYTTFHKN